MPCVSRIIVHFLLLLLPALAHAWLFVPMDDLQANHLKAYGLAYQALQNGVKVKWTLNYRGGSFLLTADSPDLAAWAVARGIVTEKADSGTLAAIEARAEDENIAVVDLEVPPRVAVYAPPWSGPWDDAVTLALEYAEIPYARIWDEEVMGGKLTGEYFDWLHLHHEDFTGQHGKFWFGFGREKWYIERTARFDHLAKSLGFATVQEEKKAVAAKIRKFVEDGGFLFAMCAATDTLDIALASTGIDIIPPEIDGTPIDIDVDSKLDFKPTLAFENFKLVQSAYVYEFSDIDVDASAEGIDFTPFYIRLNEFSARADVIPSMLVQDHVNLVKGFLGQTTGFHQNVIKKDVTVLASPEGKDWAFYIHGDRGKGTFTFLCGHDPEDYAHRVGDAATKLDLFPNSPGYRLILNNILFPAAKVKKKKT